ncbi:MAG: hypothetical protein NT090_25575 [Acidobacteria bacterium]|nr:hypothetical protein [Acidobacteriota bacterium]
MTLAAQQETTWAVIRQPRNLDPKVAPGSKVLFVDDPFEQWDMYFVRTLKPRPQHTSRSRRRKLRRWTTSFSFAARRSPR